MGLIIGDEGYGETSVAAVKLGSETVNKIYCGSNLVWNTGASGNTISGTATNYADFFGYDLALNSTGSRVVVGSYGEKDSSNTINSGAVRVFDFNTSTSQWTQSGPTIEASSGQGWFGVSVAANQDATRIVVGAPQAEKVEVWEQTSSTGTTWSRVGSIISSSQSSELFGYSVGISSNGNRIVVGSPHVTTTQYANWGKARVYDWNASTSAWDQVGSDINGDIQYGRLGYSTAISGDGTRIALGVPFETNTTGTTAGAVKIYDWNASTSAWDQVGSDIEGVAAGDRFGWRVDLNSDGSRLLVGTNYTDANGTMSGSVYAYDLVGTTWTQKGQTVHGDNNDQLGYSISLNSDGSKFIASAWGNKKVKVYELVGSSWSQIGQDHTHSFSSMTTNSRFGIGVGISGDGTVAAGGAAAVSNPGAVVVFDVS